MEIKISNIKITNEIKFKVALQYYGHKLLLCYNIEGNPVIRTFDSIHIDYYAPDAGNKRDLLILKPLSSITDEDVKVIGFSNSDEFLGLSSINEKYIGKLSDFQYLQSKGYDLPQYELNNKTLKEAGLAIYETLKAGLVIYEI